MKAEKKAAEKEAKVKEQEEKESTNSGAQNACVDEETLDPNVRLFLFVHFLHASFPWLQSLSTSAGEIMSKVMDKRGDSHNLRP